MPSIKELGGKGMIITCLKHKVTLFFLFFATIIFFYFFLSYNKKNSITFLFDYALKQSAERALREIITPDKLFKQSINKLCYAAQEAVPVINNIRCRYKPLGNSFIEVTCEQPCAQIISNGKTVIATQAGKLFETDFYKKSYIQELPIIKLLSPEIENSYLEKFIKKTTKSLLDSYAIFWKDPTEIYCVPHEMPHIQLKLTADSDWLLKLTPLITHFSQRVIPQLEAKELKKSKKIYTIDMRFKDYIILSSNNKGIA